MEKQKPLVRERAKELKRKKIIAYDIETGASVGDAFFGEFNYGMAYDGERYYDFSSMQEFLQWSLQFPGYTFLAHNAKGYELVYLLDYLREMFLNDPSYTIETVAQGKTIIQFTLKQKTTTQKLNMKSRQLEDVTKTKTWKYGDTLPIFVDSLKEVTKAYAPDHLKMSGAIDFEKEVFDILNPLHRQYLETDCAGLYHAYRRMEELMFETFGCALGMTAGSTSMKAFKACIPEGKAYYRMHPDVDAMAREAYKGGIVLPGLSTHLLEDVTVHDAKAAYGYHMKTKWYPVGSGVHTFRYIPGKQAVYRCVVHAPVDLPVGFISEKGSSILPLGTFEATVTSAEIEFGEQYGYRFEIQEGFYWEESEQVFRYFAELCEKLETTCVMVDGQKNYPYKPVAKLMRNSLYGKFGTKEQSEGVIFTHEPGPSHEIFINPRTGEIVEGLYSYTEEIDEAYMIPIWAAFITAYQRIYLMELVYLAYSMGARSIYCDTDSMTIETVIVKKMKEAGHLQSNGLYGSWEYEGRGDMLALAPKVYRLQAYTEEYVAYLENETPGEFEGTQYDLKKSKVRAKGVPINSQAATLRIEGEKIDETKKRSMYDDVARGVFETVEWDSHNSVLTRLKNPGLDIRKPRKRKMSNILMSDGWNYDVDTGTIFPVVRNSSKEKETMVQ